MSLDFEYLASVDRAPWFQRVHVAEDGTRTKEPMDFYVGREASALTLTVEWYEETPVEISWGGRRWVLRQATGHDEDALFAALKEARRPT